MRTFATPLDLLDAVGEDLGAGAWFEVTQQRIDAFAAATGDDQWIHVDPVRAAAGPHGTTIAHGHLVTSLLAVLTADVLTVEGATAAINAGSDRVRFLTPVPAGARIRAGARIADVTHSRAGVKLFLAVTVELEGADRPAAVAETLTVYLPRR